VSDVGIIVSGRWAVRPQVDDKPPILRVGPLALRPDVSFSQASDNGNFALIRLIYGGKSKIRFRSRLNYGAVKLSREE